MASSFHMYGIENKIYKIKHKQQNMKKIDVLPIPQWQSNCKKIDYHQRVDTLKMALTSHRYCGISSSISFDFPSFCSANTTKNTKYKAF